MKEGERERNDVQEKERKSKKGEREVGKGESKKGTEGKIREKKKVQYKRK